MTFKTFPSVWNNVHFMASWFEFTVLSSTCGVMPTKQPKAGGECWANHSGRAGRDTGFSLVWHIRPLFKITTHHIVSHGRIHQGARVCNVQYFENRTEFFSKAYNYGSLDANQKVRLILSLSWHQSTYPELMMGFYQIQQWKIGRSWFTVLVHSYFGRA